MTNPDSLQPLAGSSNAESTHALSPSDNGLTGDSVAAVKQCGPDTPVRERLRRSLLKNSTVVIPNGFIVRNLLLL